MLRSSPIAARHEQVSSQLRDDLTAGRYGDEGRLAVNELFSRAEQLGVYERPVRVEFVE